MQLHRYKLGYVPFKLVQGMKDEREPFGLHDVKTRAEKHALFFEKIVTAFSADDALVQLRATEGGSMNQPPFVITIEPLEDDGE